MENVIKFMNEVVYIDGHGVASQTTNGNVVLMIFGVCVAGALSVLVPYIKHKRK